jgi:hypothetical protein
MKLSLDAEPAGCYPTKYPTLFLRDQEALETALPLHMPDQVDVLAGGLGR